MKNTHKRLNITLSETTVAMLESVADKGERSSFIDVAIREHIKSVKQKQLREKLTLGAIARGSRDVGLAEEWLDIDDEIWQS